VICGGTGAGKTTLLRAMAADISPSERIITIEDSLELGLDRYPDLHSDCIALEARRTWRAKMASAWPSWCAGRFGCRLTG
jgi:Flp pilus assembly CpaF family ATPase